MVSRMAVPLILPFEIWRQIFSCLDQTSIRNVSATCNRFFGIVRGDEKLSGHIILTKIDLRQLVKKIESEEWNWDRWSCLKILEIPIQIKNSENDRHFFSEFDTVGEALDPIKMLKLKQCPSLDKLLIFNCAFPLFLTKSAIEDLVTFYTLIPTEIGWADANVTLPAPSVLLYYGLARTVCLNPKIIPKNLSLEDVTSFEITKLKNMCTTSLKQIGEKATQINSLSIDLESNQLSHELITKGFSPMLEQLKSTLTTFSFTMWCGHCGVNGLLKALSENCVNLEVLHIKNHKKYINNFLIAEYSFPRLKELTVPKLKHISSFVSDAKDLTNLKVENVTNELEFFSFDFSNILTNLIHLQNCEIFVKTIICHQYDWAKFINANFQPRTKVVVYQLSNSQTKAVFMKPPYQKTKIVREAETDFLQTRPIASGKVFKYDY